MTDKTARLFHDRTGRLRHLLVTRECIDDPNKVPEIYNKATSCVWRDGAWLLMEDTETAILLSAPIINELPPAEAAA